jgi:hypothetical protein
VKILQEWLPALTWLHDSHHSSRTQKLHLNNQVCTVCINVTTHAQSPNSAALKKLQTALQSRLQKCEPGSSQASIDNTTIVQAEGYDVVERKCSARFPGSRREAHPALWCPKGGNCGWAQESAVPAAMTERDGVDWHSGKVRPVSAARKKPKWKVVAYREESTTCIPTGRHSTTNGELHTVCKHSSSPGSDDGAISAYRTGTRKVRCQQSSLVPVPPQRGYMHRYCATDTVATCVPVLACTVLPQSRSNHMASPRQASTSSHISSEHLPIMRPSDQRCIEYRLQQPAYTNPSFDMFDEVPGVDANLIALSFMQNR